MSRFFLWSVLVIAVAASPPAASQPSAKRMLMQKEKEFAAGLIASSSQTGKLRSDETGPFIGVTTADTDGDGLSDNEEKTAGTDAENPDTDGDALLDGWEVRGVNDIDLKGLGADPLQKDIFVEMDFMRRATATRGLAPSAAVIQRIVDAFAAAPVTNPNGQSGIRMHAMLGNEVPHDQDLNPYRTQFAALKRAHFDVRRAPVFHYMIWADQYNGGTSSGISLNIPHSDFIVTLGAWNGRTGGTDDQKVGTFIHELGHNLGLLHGGSEHINFKPNHLSVMNYVWQMSGVIVNNQQVYTYQPFVLDALNENSLDEARGIGSAVTLAGWLTAFILTNGSTARVPADGPINWNEIPPATDTALAIDVNGDGALDDLQGTPNEWTGVVYAGGTIGSFDPLQGLTIAAEAEFRELPPELTEELFLALVASNN